MAVDEQDRNVIRELAARVAEIAAMPDQAKTISQCKKLNALKPVRPMVMIDQIPWHEMDVDGELTLRTKDPFCRGMETALRRTLYAWAHMRVDQVVEPIFEVPKVIRGMDYGIQAKDETVAFDPSNDVVSHCYEDRMKTDEDVDKIRPPVISFDVQATSERAEKAQELLQDLLSVRTQGWMPFFCPWDVIVQWRGAESLLFDLVDKPEMMHRAMSRLTDAYLSMLDQMEDKGLLSSGQATIHCTGAFTDELPAAGHDPERPRAKDVWTCGMAQIFSSVSPAMLQEFELDYAVRWYARFGLVYYGCCEPLDAKADLLRQIPHLRKISMSPWVNVERGAERLGRDFVFSRKPNPSFLAGDTWDPRVVEKDLSATLDACRRHATPVELILKDISTVRYEPRRLWQWAEIARGVTGK